MSNTQEGYRGISFPFRISSRGGCVTSTTSATDPTHIEESIKQILQTSLLERPMEGGSFYSDIITLLYEPNDTALQSVMRFRVVDALTRLEPRISVDAADIEFSVEVKEDGTSILNTVITYTILKYGTTFTTTVEMGDVNATID